MIFTGFSSSNLKTPAILTQIRFFPNIFDIIAFLIIFGFISLVALGTKGMDQSLAKLEATPIVLSYINLFKYSLYTALRMFAAIFASLLFTFIVATLAAKSRKAEMIIIPALDILQSVPILGFLTFTVPFCMGLFPSSEFGVELAAIFAIFTSQAWNMTFSLYQSLRTVPVNLREVSSQFCLNKRQKFWRLEVPFAIPGLVWNTMMSMSGGWFFVVASEAISIGNTQINLPGIGSWLATAIDQKDFHAVAWAVLAMGIVILLYDQVIFRPIVAWSDKFNMSLTASQKQSKSWIYDVIRRSNILAYVMHPIGVFCNWCIRYKPKRFINTQTQTKQHKLLHNKLFDVLWLMCIYALVIISTFVIVHYLHAAINAQMFFDVCVLGMTTLLRVIVLIFIASIIWLPLGVWVGLRPKLVAWIQPLAQFLAAFPANILFPIFVIGILKFDLNPDIWLSPLMILGTQWYIFFNVIAGASAFPNDLQEAANIYQLKSWLWWRKIILPGILPYYVTGALTASGGSWNASIVAEVARWGTTKLEAKGLGSFIANATEVGDFHQVVLGVAIMCMFVIIINRIFWQRLYTYAAKNSGQS